MPQEIAQEVRLRSPEPADFEAIRTIREDILTQDLLLAYPRAKKASAREWFEAKIKSTDTAFLTITTSKDAHDMPDTAVGYAQFSSIHRAGRFASFGLAIAPAYRGLGLGRAATQEALRWARDVLGMRKILLEVRGDNAVARRIYEDIGFRHVGTLVAHYHDGSVFHPVVLMEKFLDESAA